MPTTSSKVPGAVKEVEDRRAYWLKRRDEAKEKGFVAEEEVASSSKPKQPNGVAKGRGPNPTLDLTTEEWPGELLSLPQYDPNTVFRNLDSRVDKRLATACHEPAFALLLPVSKCLLLHIKVNNITMLLERTQHGD